MKITCDHMKIIVIIIINGCHKKISERLIITSNMTNIILRTHIFLLYGIYYCTVIFNFPCPHTLDFTILCEYCYHSISSLKLLRGRYTAIRCLRLKSA